MKRTAAGGECWVLTTRSDDAGTGSCNALVHTVCSRSAESRIDSPSERALALDRLVTYV